MQKSIFRISKVRRYDFECNDIECVILQFKVKCNTHRQETSLYLLSLRENQFPIKCSSF